MSIRDLTLSAELRVPLISDLVDLVNDVGPAPGIPLIAVGVGFLIGIWGHMARSERAIGFGILMVFVSSILFFLGSLTLQDDLPPPDINESEEECRPLCK